MKRSFSLLMIYIIAVFSVFLFETKVSGQDVYRVGIDDVIEIKVLDHAELNLRVRVSFDGTISFPYLGAVYIKDMSIEEIGKDITTRLSEGYIKYPVVTVSLAESFSRRIFTYGEFRKIGTIPFTDNMTLLNTLSLAGGVNLDGLYGKLIIKRKKVGGSDYMDLIEVDLNNGLIENKKIRDMMLHIDDILILEKSKSFLVQGEVQARGRFILEKDMTVLRALLERGGVSANAMFGSIKLRRKKKGVPGGYVDFAQSKLADGIIENKEVEDIFLQTDDILILEKSKSFLVQGEVQTRGKFILEKDMTVLRALLEAGGASTEGRFGKIRIRRKEEGEAGKYRDIAESSLNNGMIESREVEDIVLQSDDVLIVERNKTFLIYGEVNKTGEFILEKDMTVFKAITIASGFTKWGSGNRVNILRSVDNGKSFKTIRVNIEKVIGGKVEADVKLLSGDIIVVSSGIF